MSSNVFAPRVLTVRGSSTLRQNALIGRNARLNHVQVLQPWKFRPKPARIAEPSAARASFHAAAALTADVPLLAVIHLRVLLPPDLENWTVEVFGFIPKRSTIPVCSTSTFPEARAPKSGLL